MKPPACLCRLQSSSSTISTPFVAIGRKRRFLSTSSGDCDDVSTRLREVMRNVPQPVAIVTARNTSPSSSSAYHGATLTSFTSLTLHPHPLVAFSLRLPSRLADCLRSSSTSSHPKSPPGKTAPKAAQARIPLTVSLLCRSNRPIADALSSRLPDQSDIFARDEWLPPKDSYPPSLRDALGALTCEVVSSMPLRDMCDVEAGPAGRRGGMGVEGSVDGVQEAEVGTGGYQAGSELFICRVLDVLPGSEGVEPLLHLKQSYVGVERMEEDEDDGSYIVKST